MRTGQGAGRRNVIAVFATGLLAGGFLSVIVSGSPALAASHFGSLRIYGPGSVYTGMNHIVSKAVAAGSAATYSVQVVNKGSATAQFNVRITGPVPGADNPAALAITTSGAIITPLAVSSDGYYTIPLAAGKAQTFNLSVTPAKTDPQGITRNVVNLYATDGTFLGNETVDTNVKAPTKGTTPWDLFIHNGSQPNIGGSFDDQYATAPSITAKQTAVFTVRLQNDSTSTSRIGLEIDSNDGCGASFPIVSVKDGSNNVTPVVVNHLFATGTLAPGTGMNLTLTLGYAPGGPNCTAARWDVRSLQDQNGPLAHEDFVIVNLAG